MTIDDHIAAVRNRPPGTQECVVFVRVDKATRERLLEAAAREGVSLNTLAWAALKLATEGSNDDLIQ